MRSARSPSSSPRSAFARAAAPLIRPNHCTTDTGFFNYTDYQHSALRMLIVGITTEVKASLLAGNDACCLDVEVRTRRGTVRLYGSVDAQWQADKAVRVASAVSGVRHVTNDLIRKP